jgi:transcriptional regulator with XRE-family HTH domain
MIRKKHTFPLRQLLADAEWTQEELAKSARICMPTVNGIVNDRLSPRWETIAKILLTLGYEIKFERVAGAPRGKGAARRAEKAGAA